MTTYYVATNGNNSANGSADSPWRTISHAVKANLKPGDEVVVRSGTYNEAVTINKDGKAGDYITIRSEVPGGAKIDPPGTANGVMIIADYVKFDGFEVFGSKGSGIVAHGVHHVEITNNIVHDNVSNGIFVGQFDYALIEGNVVYDNSEKGASSGIHLKAAYNITGNTSDDGFRVIVRGNVTYGNETKYGPMTDGSGISLDDFNNHQIPSLPAYKFKTLVEGNITHSNSGRGIQVAWSDHATIRGNISMDNNVGMGSGTWISELANMASSNTTWIGNRVLTDAGNPAIANLTFKGEPTNTDVRWYDNLTFNGKLGDASVYANFGNSKPTAADGNLLGHDPKLTLADLKAMELDLLKHGSFRMPWEAPEPEPQQPSGLTIRGDAANNVLIGGTEGDKLYGGAGNDKLYAAAGRDELFGGEGNDLLSGGYGSDRLSGGNGVDILVGGGGGDTFIFAHLSNAKGDVIRDFSRSQGDEIDLSGVDANTKVSGNQAFSFIGGAAFSGTAGELHYVDGVVSGDVNGDRRADFLIEIANDHALVASDFLL